MSSDDVPPAGLGPEPLPAPPRRPLPAMLLAAVLGVAAAAALHGGLTGRGPARADGALLVDAVAARTEGLTLAARVVTEVGNTAAMAVLAVLTGVLLWRRARPVDAVFAVAAMAGAAVAFLVGKVVLDRARPPAALRLTGETTESLPSGHATMSIVVIGSLVALAWAGRGVAGRTVMLAAAALWVAAVGATRVYLGVHWFSDVLAGWLLGAAWLAACLAVRAWWLRRDHPAPEHHAGATG